VTQRFRDLARGVEIASRAVSSKDRENSSSVALACTRRSWYIDGEEWQEEEMFRKAPCHWFLRKPSRLFYGTGASVDRA
jgi:hypothetical protein